MATPDDAVRARTSLLTPVGRGAVAVIAAEGDAALTAIEAHFRAANGLRLRDQPLNRVLFGHWTSLEQTGGEHREEVVVCRTEAIRVEVHCHGGLAAGERILNALDRRGCQVEPWINWVRSDAACELDAEGEIALASAVTLRTAAILLDQRHGALRAEIEAALNELARKNDDGVAAARRLIDAVLDRAALGLRLSRPWQAAIAGRPNVGKSCLINALVGYQRAIVFDQPGTTRDVLAADTAIDGWPVRLSDSAGLRAVDDPLEAAGVALAKEQLARADLIVWVLDATALDAAARNDPATTARREMEREIGQLSSAPTLVVVNKSDLATLAPSGDCVVTSAVTGAGLESLLAAIAGRLVPRTPDAGAAVPFTARQATLLLSARNAIAAGDVTLASHELSRVIISNGPASPR